jgi:hypothetical protein
MSNMFIDVHTFDGKLNGIFIPIKEYTLQEKQEKFGKLIHMLHNKSAINAVKTILSDLSNNKQGNLQSENNIDASDILIHLLHLQDNPDIIKGIDEQLSDATNLGMCPSGRCTRLLQLWVAFKS